MVGHPRNPGYQAGNHWVECQRCGFEYRADEIKIEWTGAIVCDDCWEPRHPQDFVRSKGDKIYPEEPINPPHEPVFLETEGQLVGPTAFFIVYDRQIVG